MEAIPPIFRHVVRIPDDFLDQLFGVVYSVIIWNHPPGDGEDGAEQAEIEEDSTVWRDLKVEEQIRIDNGRQSKNRCKGSRNERNEPKIGSG